MERFISRIKTITRKIADKQSCQLLFSTPVQPELDGLENYFDIVKKPMDLGKIQDNLKKSVYKTPKEWYDDMCLVFQNAINYYSEENPISLIAKYRLDEFYKEAVGLELENDEEWLESVQKESKKLIDLFARPPSIQKANSKLNNIKALMDTQDQPTTAELATYLEKLNMLGKDQEAKEDLYTLLSDIGGIMPDSIKEMPIDLEKLNPDVVKSLYLYARERLL
ncbi:Bromodomain containing protein [Tritrichomonas foetus]|uniref:Bromodomain containing protein n=1 Tax=Tritrichomonas foetus TaxID=1144522 RepID=A0A1J4JCQ3_9EUKA|nr:Bromodomain containing protein [Tritrichomonas foetus]|eukprot:OHS96986.1 Bromodomain containing protein [Tritrichomonas foetus]